MPDRRVESIEKEGKGLEADCCLGHEGGIEEGLDGPEPADVDLFYQELFDVSVNSEAQGEEGFETEEFPASQGPLHASVNFEEDGHGIDGLYPLGRWDGSVHKGGL